MLDKKTLEWLADREENLEIFGGFFCPNCPEFVLEDEGFMYCGRGGGEQCIVDNPHKFIFKDAAEFEARVAVELAKTFDGPEPCEWGEIKHCPYESNGMRATITCAWCRLKHARIAVEEEMEKI